jgi:hypothetical protein
MVQNKMIMKDSVSIKNHYGIYNNLRVFILVAFILFFMNIAHGYAGEKDKLVIGHFSQNNYENWDKKVFAGESQYQLVQLDDQIVLKAQARNSASGLVKKVRVDLRQTPFLNWSWRVETPHPFLDERSKQGDDYAARVYIVVDGGLMFWKTIALNYVWSSSQAIGSSWSSAYAGKNVKLVALRSKEHRLSKWYTEKQNVYKDFKHLFHKSITHIDGVAIMTDSDNSGGEAIAYYGDIFFTAF